jgi:hypothetical protein
MVWRSSSTALSYNLQVSASNAFSSPVVDTVLTDTVAQLSPLNANARYYWRVAASNDSGAGSYSPVAAFMTGDQISSVEENPPAPQCFALMQNYPNPFNPTTSIGYSVGDDSRQSSVVSSVKLVVYDVLGREVAVLVDGQKEPGTYRIDFDGTHLASGIYICRMAAGSFVECRKMVLMK